ncbi:MAG: hypothetical protein PHO37_17930 [Kiritimatiellae bacterium]|nr:hypothetical protein [Kiritimatiellia bacterium]
MKTLLTDFRSEFRDRILDLLWRQWSAFGVAGHGTQWYGSPIDPEALLLLTCTVGRYDARLFDGMVEWMELNGQLINVQRLKRIIATEQFAGEQVLRAVAATVSDSVSAAKWATTVISRDDACQPVPLFFLKDGTPMPIVRQPDKLFAGHGLKRDPYEARGVAQVFRAELVPNLILRLRAFFGVNARCEIIAYLLLNEQGSPSSLARDAYYFPLTISKALAEMRGSGFLVSRVEGRRREHKLVPGTWRELLLGEECPRSLVWPRLFRAIEILWEFLGDSKLTDKEPLAQASALRRVLSKSVVDRAETSGLDFAFGNLAANPGETLITFAVGRIKTLLTIMESPNNK